MVGVTGTQDIGLIMIAVPNNALTMMEDTLTVTAIGSLDIGNIMIVIQQLMMINNVPFIFQDTTILKIIGSTDTGATMIAINAHTT